MEALRETWTDERLDDMRVEIRDDSAKVDRRFEAVDKRFDRVDARVPVGSALDVRADSGLTPETAVS